MEDQQISRQKNTARTDCEYPERMSMILHRTKHAIDFDRINFCDLAPQATGNLLERGFFYSNDECRIYRNMHKCRPLYIIYFAQSIKNRRFGALVVSARSPFCTLSRWPEPVCALSLSQVGRSDCERSLWAEGGSFSKNGVFTGRRRIRFSIRICKDIRMFIEQISLYMPSKCKSHVAISENSFAYFENLFPSVCRAHRKLLKAIPKSVKCLFLAELCLF